MTVKIISFNTWLLRIPFLGAKWVNWRRNQMMEAITAQSADLVCLQEVWHRQDIRFFAGKFHQLGYTTAHHRIGILGSGLMIASKHPISSQRFISNHARAFGPEKLITKGALKIEILVHNAASESHRLVIVNAHLGAEVSRLDRAADIDRVFEFAVQESSESTSVIVAGDLAIDPFLHGEWCEEYRRIRDYFQFHDVFPNRIPGAYPTMLAQNPFAKPAWHGQSIDYIFYRGNMLRQDGSATIFLDTPLQRSRNQLIFASDHAGVMATLNLSRE
jgi:endonuclease/exonuclease/phosphatase family metal-dependent hydrolase